MLGEGHIILKFTQFHFRFNHSLFSPLNESEFEIGEVGEHPPFFLFFTYQDATVDLVPAFKNYMHA